MLFILDQSYTSFLYQIGNVTWIAYVLVLLVVFWRGFGDSSYYFGTTVLVLCNLLMQIVEPALVSFGKTYPTIIVHLWYTFWAALDAFAVYSIFVLHRRANVRLGFVAKSLALSFSALCVAQALRYFDRVIFQTDLLGSFYSIGINAINLSCLAVILVPVYKVISSKKVFAKWLS